MVSRYKGIIQGGGRSAGGKEDGRVVGKGGHKRRENEDVWSVLETGETKGTMLRRGGMLGGSRNGSWTKKKAGLDPLLGEKYLIPSLPWSLVINQAKIRVACLYFKRA